MITLFFWELVALVIIYYFFIGLNFTDNALRVFGACSVICLCYIFLFFDILPIPLTFFFVIILAFLFEEKIYFLMALTMICILFEMIAGYSIMIIMYMITKTVEPDIFSLTPKLDCYLYIFETVFSFLLRQQRKNRAESLRKIDAKSYWFLFTVCFFSICFISLAEAFLYSQIDKSGYYFTALSFMIALIAILFITSVVIIILRHYNIKLQRINYLKQRCLELEQANYFDSKNRVEEIRAFRHDFNSHILALQNLADLKEWDKLNKYIHQLSIDKNSFSLYNISTGNVTADAVINHFQHTLENDIVFKISGQFQKECFVEDMDICIIFSNLLNNAHEAFEYIEGNRSKEIYLSIEAASDRIVFIVENTSKSYTEKELEYLQTSKTDKLNHGFGLMNVRQVSEKYHGELLVKFSDGFFVTTTILYNR